ncbi:MAG: dihydroorotase [Candidatus Muproteobacteria bacterium RBG_16_62_13]|uniref:Dihydroorotase n=1 Tax=Candidatus Muproteobacteria bacterium RBG_16_62_13 TaxID=1817756 RepID=A0A1F6T3L9_9PROT|nr:MAG: dihydroorotase [Candidatus Muproteobacteria bacterium RBG_16_62_13]
MRLSLTRPDDWHLHLRDGATLVAVLPDTARRFARAIVMPNLKPPVTTVELARAYRERILAVRPPGSDFEPLMTLYLTDSTAPGEIAKAKASGFVHAVKYYPAGATTHSESGVTDLKHVYPVLAEMEKHDLPLLLHGEVTDSDIDVFDREAVFIERHLAPLARAFPKLRIVLEHVTTKQGVSFVEQAGPNVAATITAHHLLLNRNAMFAGGLRPHAYCLPVLKREEHRQALVRAATSGNRKFFLGTDSAAHGKRSKESACGCAGIYTAHAALELYAEVFEAAGALDKLEAFASHHGADFYRLPRNRGKVELVKEPWTVATDLAFGDDRLIPMRAGETVGWRLAG